MARFPELQGKVALITGAGRRDGLGEGIARRLLAEGCTVVLTDIGKGRGAEMPVTAVGTDEEMAQVAADQTISTLTGPPTPDDLDSLLAKVWKTPSFILTHPLGVAAFGREATRRGVPPVVTSLFGGQFVTWRGIPIIPSDKVPVEDGKTKFIVVRTGEERQGVVGLFQPGLVGEQSPGLSVRFNGINRQAIASYLVSLYSALAVLTDDALAVLDGAEVGVFHEYA